MAQGRFRQDLFYRLSGMSFALPPLRQRVQDIMPLARGMVARSARQFRKPLFTIDPAVAAALRAFPWPGNIRQMQNLLQQAVLVSNGSALMPQHLPAVLQGEPAYLGPAMTSRCQAIHCRVTARCWSEP